MATLNALAKVRTAAAMAWADTPNVRDRYTRDSAQQLMADALDGVVSGVQALAFRRSANPG